MARAKDVSVAVSKGVELAPQRNTLSSLLASVNIRERFKEMLGNKSAGFMSSILSVANQNKMLATAEPLTIISAAAVAASLDLAINPSLGFAHLVPYRDGKTGKVIAQFQMGWRGFIQLAMRSGQYKTVNVTEVYDGEIIKHNRITGEMEFDPKADPEGEVVGYVAYMKLLNGFEKYLYMTKANVEKHGKRYSKSYDSGQWSKDFDAMAKKTVIKMLLSKFGILSIEMQKAITTDQAVLTEIDGELQYPDVPEGLTTDVPKDEPQAEYKTEPAQSNTKSELEFGD